MLGALTVHSQIPMTMGIQLLQCINLIKYLSTYKVI